MFASPVPVTRSPLGNQRVENMRKIVSHLIITLDGVVEFDVVHQQIAELRENDEVLEDFFSKLKNEDAMLLGRKTYEDWKDYWPTSEIQPFADHINGVNKYVISNTLNEVQWGERKNISLIRDNQFEKIAALKNKSGKNIGIHGSGKLVSSLLYAGILDELRLEIYPIIAGSGDRLFSEGSAVKSLKLLDQKVTPNGVSIVTYQPLRNA